MTNFDTLYSGRHGKLQEDIELVRTLFTVARREGLKEKSYREWVKNHIFHVAFMEKLQLVWA